MINFFQTIFISLVILIPSIYAIILKSKLEVAEYQRDYYRNRTLSLNATIRRHLGYKEEEYGLFEGYVKRTEKVVTW